MKKPLLTLIVSLGMLTFSYGQAIPTNYGEQITIADMGAFSGTYNYIGSNASAPAALASGYPVGTIVNVYDAAPGTGTLGTVRVASINGGTENHLFILDITKDGIQHRVSIGPNGQVLTNRSLSGDGLKLVDGTLNNFMATWPGGGTGPRYIKMVNARARAQKLAERLSFQNGRWSPLP